MENVTKVQSTVEKDPSMVTLDVLRASFFGNIFRFYLETLGENQKLPQEMNRNVLEQTIGQVNRFEREVRRTTKNKRLNVYLDRNLREAKLLDMATLMDCVARVGGEQHQGIYEEFLGLLIDLIDAVYYSQKHRRNMHFGKYKALFKLIGEEIKRDVNHQPGQILYTNKSELFLRTMAPEPKTEIK